MKPANFTYLELCKAYGYGLTYGLVDMGLEVPADIRADGTGLEIRADDAQSVFGASESDIIRMEQILKDLALRSAE
jgi:hypothetical protein